MRFKKILFSLLFVSFFVGCHQADKTEAVSIPAKKVESRADSLYRQTMDIHNEVMAKMGKLNGYKKKVQQQADSIKLVLASTNFPKQVAQRIAKDLDSLHVLGIKLASADSAMYAWMGQFNADPKLATSDAKADYFEKQKQLAEAMKKRFFEALSDAEKFFIKRY